MDPDAEKQAAAEWAADLVRPGMVVGLGTGSTAIFALRRIAARLQGGDLTEVVGVPTSTQVQAAARELRIPLSDLEAHPIIDLTIDGADEVDAHFNLIKGGGGALLREKIVAQASRRDVIVVDATKCSDQLGTRHRLPGGGGRLRLAPRGFAPGGVGADVVLRRAEDRSVFRTDGGNLILDADLGPTEDPETLAATLLSRAGVVEVGLFCGLVNDLVIGTLTGVEHRLGSRRP
jgi:ribose 5-phosphate isomerase A